MLDSELIFGIMASLDKQEFSVTDLKYLTEPFNITESNLRTALSRMVKKGVLANRRSGKQAYYSISKKGHTISANVALRFKTTDWSGWNGMWWGVCFSISETKSRYRYKIRKKLVNYHFKPLYSGFWIRPCHPEQNFSEILDSYYIKETARLISFKPEIDFTKDFIIRLWELEKLNQIYEENLYSLQAQKDLVKNDPEHAFISMIQTGNKGVKTLFRDPLLPDCFLPDNWKAGIFRNEFNLFIRQAKEESRKFWEEIYQEE